MSTKRENTLFMRLINEIYKTFVKPMFILKILKYNQDISLIN